MAGSPLKLTAVGQYFHVLVNGSKVSKHTTEREAIEHAANELDSRQPTDRVSYRHEYEVEVSRLTRVIDDTPPSVPGGLAVAVVSLTQLGVSWNAATDLLSPILNYDVERNGIVQAPVSGLSVSYSGLTGNTLYTFRVRARDTAGNVGAWSPAVAATTADLVAPTTPANFAGNPASSTSIALTWNAASDTGGSGVAGYQISRDGAAPIDVGNVTSYNWGSLTSGQQYSFRIRTKDGSGNLSPYSSAIAVSTSAGSGGGVDVFGISAYAFQTFITDAAGTQYRFEVPNTSGTWMTDGTGGFYRMQWPASGGTAGPYWQVADQSKREIYVRYDYRRNRSAHSKRLKIFGKGYSGSPSVYSNFTFAVDYDSGALGVSYSDRVDGGDINTQFFLGSFPTLTGGSQFSRTPHPTEVVDVATNELFNSTWQRHEIYIRHNQDGVNDGELIWWIDGVIVLWLKDMYNCRTGGQGFERVSWGDYSNGSGSTPLYEDFRNAYVAHERPARPEINLPIYSDNFETATVGSGVGGRGNSKFSFDTANAATLSVVGSNVVAYSGSRALKFDFKARPNSFNCEQPFTLSQEYQELWIGFRLYIPSNYSNTGTDSGGTTNKKFFALYNSVDGYSRGNMSIFEYEQDGNGGAVINFTFKETNAGGETVHISTPGSFINVNTDRGQWIAVGLYVKAATNARSGTYPNITSNGVMKVWKNRSLWASSTTIGNRANSGRGFNVGYILGAPNGGFPVDTPMHIDDFIIANNAVAVSDYIP